MKIKYSARSHMGNVRTNNEDNLFVNGVTLPIGMEDRSFSIDGCAEAPAIFAVCDGMGGEDDGEAASRLAVETLCDCKKRIQDAVPGGLNAAVQAYTTLASQKITLKTAIGKRSGTTLALAVVSKYGIRCFNAGDSRIYFDRRGVFRQVTYDHTVAVDLERANSGQRPRAGTGHMLTRCMGIGKPPEAERYPTLPLNGRLLICSDGLDKMMCDEEIQSVLENCVPPAQAADTLLATALQRGGLDNVTLIVIDTEGVRIPFPMR